MVFGGAMRVFASIVTVAVAFVGQSSASVGFLASEQKALLEMKQKNLALKKEMPAPRLLDAPVYFDGERQVFHSFKLKVDSLMEALASAEQAGFDAIKDSKARYEEKLKAQHEQNVAAELKNEELVQETTALLDAVAGLRSGASELNSSNEAVTTELKVLRENLSTAQEFIANAINESATKLSYTAPELQVLEELNQQEAAENQAREHENYLRSVATTGSKLSLLQFDTSTKFAVNSTKFAVNSTMESFIQHHLAARSDPEKQVYGAQQVINQLIATLRDLSNAQNASDVQLKSMFEDEYKKGEELFQALNHTQTELYAAKDAALELQARVGGAKEHLQQTYTTLLGQTNSVKQFAYQVAAGEKAQSLLRVSKESAKKVQRSGKGRESTV